MSETTIPTTPKDDIRFLLNFNRHNDLGDNILYIEAQPVRVIFEDGVERVRNLDSSGFHCEPLADFQVRCIINPKHQGGEPYGLQAIYRSLFEVDARRAEAILKVLRKLDKGLRKLETELGYADTYPIFLARVGKVLGIKQYGWVAESGSGWSHDDNTYRWTTDASAAGSKILTEIHSYLKAQGVAV